MAFRTRRQQKYTKLRASGFLPFEARPLSKVPVRVCPYMKHLTKERREMFQKARAAGMTRIQWEGLIKEKYNTNKWLRAGRIRIEADPWKMLREFEDRWKDKNPQYTSPWEKRWKDWQNFLRKAETTVQRQKGRVVT